MGISGDVVLDFAKERIHKKEALSDQRIISIVQDLESWPGSPIASHRSSQQLFHKLSFLADCGFKAQDFPKVIERILETRLTDGIFSLNMNIGKAYGGTGEDTPAWALCDAPITTWALAEMGLADHPHVIESMNRIADISMEKGWPCAVSATLGNWHGPGKKSDPCPFATLASLKMLSAFTGREKEKHHGIECLLGLWEKSMTEHPYIFYMGTDFRKLKGPLFWYDILNVLDVLSKYSEALRDPVYRNMLDCALSKKKPEGWIPESVYLHWKGWDFAQKKSPSGWLEFWMDRILKRNANG